MNLRNFDIEKLENLPKHQRILERVSGRLEVYHLGWNARSDYSRSRLDMRYHIAFCIFRGSVGKHISTIRRKIKPYLIPSRYNNSDPIDWWLDKDFARFRRRFDVHYLDDDGYLRFIPKKPDPNRKKLGYPLKPKKQKKDKNKSLYFLKFINNPTLLKFYRELVSTIRKYQTALEKQYVIAAPKADYGTWSRWNDMLRARTIFQAKEEARKKLPKLLDDLEKIEAGDYTPYYQSQTYQFSIGKECPHMESPIKSKI